MDYALLSESLSGVKHPLGETEDVKELLERLELKVHTLAQEDSQIDSQLAALEAEYGKLIDMEQSKFEQRRECERLQRERQKLDDFVASLQKPHTVTYQGRDILVNVANTRAKEHELMDQYRKEMQEFDLEMEKINKTHASRVETVQGIMDDLSKFEQEIKDN